MQKAVMKRKKTRHKSPPWRWAIRYVCRMQGPSIMGLSHVTLISGSQVPYSQYCWETEPVMEDSKRQRLILCITRIKDYKELFFFKGNAWGRGQRTNFHLRHAWGLCFAQSWQERTKGISRNMNSERCWKAFHEQWVLRPVWERLS